MMRHDPGLPTSSPARCILKWEGEKFSPGLFGLDGLQKGSAAHVYQDLDHSHMFLVDGKNPALISDVVDDYLRNGLLGRGPRWAIRTSRRTARGH